MFCNDDIINPLVSRIKQSNSFHFCLIFTVLKTSTVSQRYSPWNSLMLSPEPENVVEVKIKN